MLGALAATALRMAERCKAITDKPVLIGVGVSNASQAAEAVTVADGVIQGASVMRRLLDGGPDAVAAYVALARRTATRALASGRLRAADAEPLLDALGARPNPDWNGSR